MSEKPAIKVTIQPDTEQIQALEQRLEHAGLPQDGTPDSIAATITTPPTLTPANVQTGVGVLKDHLPSHLTSESTQPPTHARDQENQRDSEADSLPQ
jgi:hypothetical protein